MEVLIFILVVLAIAGGFHYYSEHTTGTSAFDLDKDGDVDLDDAKVAVSAAKFKLADLKKKTKAELLKLAKKEKLVVGARDTKAKILEAFKNLAD